MRATAEIFSDIIDIYYDKGWSLVPCRSRRVAAERGEGVQKSVTPLADATGELGEYLTREAVKGYYSLGCDDWNTVAVRAPRDVVGLDIDVYGDKHGDATIAEIEQGLVIGGRRFSEGIGELPLTWTSTARAFGTGSGIRWYRVPPGAVRKDVGGAVEVVRWDHRFAVVSPSVHPVTRTLYRWYDAAGAECEPPAVSELPELPEAWVARLGGSRGRGSGAREAMDVGDAENWFSQEAIIDSARLSVKNGNSRHVTIFEAAREFAYADADTTPLKVWAMTLGLREWDVDRQISQGKKYAA